MERLQRTQVISHAEVLQPVSSGSSWWELVGCRTDSRSAARSTCLMWQTGWERVYVASAIWRIAREIKGGFERVLGVGDSMKATR